MQLALALIADAQATELTKPANRALYYPAVASQPLMALDPASCDPGHDPALSQQATVPSGIVPFVGMQLLRSPPGATVLLPQREDPLHQGHQLGSLVDIRRRREDREGVAPPIHQNVMFRACLAPIGRVLAGLGAPFLAGTVAASALARLQSIWPARLSLSSMRRCTFSQTPPWCQSRSRRQQVIPEPQPISWGSISQGMPE
jgi:hypothetical protein